MTTDALTRPSASRSWKLSEHENRKIKHRSEPFFVLPEREFPDNDQGRLAERIIGSLASLDLALENPRIRLNGYTGIYWRRKDRPMIRELHQDLDHFWESRR